MQDHHTVALADRRKFRGKFGSSQKYSARFAAIGKVTVKKLRIRIHKVTDPNLFTNLDPVTNLDPYTNLNLVTNPNPITNLDLDTTPPPPRSLLLIAVRFFNLGDQLEAKS
jgi:hypothetical protein